MLTFLKIYNFEFLPGRFLFCSTSPSHVHRYVQLHILGSLPGEVLHGKEQHVGVGFGGGVGVELGSSL